MRNLLELFKKEEANARDLLDEKNILSQRIVVLREDIDNQKSKEGELKQEKIEVKNIEDENRYLQSQIEDTNKNYYKFIEKFSNDSDYFQSKIFDLNSKLIHETNSKESLIKDKDILDKSLYKFNSENVHHNRTL